MKLVKTSLLLILINCNILVAQYSFTGYVDIDRWQSDVYLSYVEDYRKINGIYSDQIISKVTVDSLGNFKFIGNQLEKQNRIYRIHVDNCNIDEEGLHFNGHCSDSKEIIFIAKNSDTINFPSTFDDQMFCSINSTNESTNSLVKIDSIINLMKFSYTDFNSEANNKLNDKKWFSTLQEFGRQLNEPLANLYIYEFLSNRSNVTYDYYLKDIETNDYYSDISNNLKAHYAESSYADQFSSEFNADNYVKDSQNKRSTNFPKWVLLGIGLLLLGNGVLLTRFLIKKSKSTNTLLNNLTKQEVVIFNLMRQNKSNKEIAEINFISVSTVKTHISNIYKKLNISSRDELKSL